MMKEECYHFADGRLIIHDPELNIFLDDHFLPTRIDVLDPKASILQEGEELVLRQDFEQRLQIAYIQKNGKQHGHMCYFYSDGRLQGESFYKEGKLHGPSCFYSDEGGKLSMSWFFEGQYQGKLYQYYKNGDISSIQRYKHGLSEGCQEYFYEEGKYKSIMHYHKSKLHGKIVLFWPSGLIKREAFFHEGQKEGWDRVWSEKNVLIDAGCYSGGHPVDKHCRWHENGNPHEEIIYYTPQRFDKRRWDMEQQLIYEGVYDEDLNYTEKTLLVSGEYQVQKGRWDNHRLVLDDCGAIEHVKT